MRYCLAVTFTLRVTVLPVRVSFAVIVTGEEVTLFAVNVTLVPVLALSETLSALEVDHVTVLSSGATEAIRLRVLPFSRLISRPSV